MVSSSKRINHLGQILMIETFNMEKVPSKVLFYLKTFPWIKIFVDSNLFDLDKLLTNSHIIESYLTDIKWEFVFFPFWNFSSCFEPLVFNYLTPLGCNHFYKIFLIKITISSYIGLFIAHVSILKMVLKFSKVQDKYFKFTLFDNYLIHVSAFEIFHIFVKFFSFYHMFHFKDFFYKNFCPLNFLILFIKPPFSL